MCEINLETSRIFVASVFGTPLVVRIHSNLYLFRVVTTPDAIVTAQQYSVVTWHYIETRRGSPVDRRPSTAEAPPIAKIHPFSKMAVTFEPLI